MRFTALAILALTFWIVPAAQAQRRVSADVKAVSVNNGQRVTVEKSLYLQNTGRLVIEQHRPERLIYVTNTLGEMKIYSPDRNEVMSVSDAEMSSGKEILSFFMNNGYIDMGLPQYGYTLRSVDNIDGKMVKTFVPQAKNKGVMKVELVFDRHLPVCMIYYNAKDKPLRKVFFSKYVSGNMPVPTRVTEIEYTSPRDSVVRLSIYSNLLFDRNAASEMFDFTVPEGAAAVSYTQPKQ